MIRFSMFSLRKVHLLFDEQNLNQNIYVFFNSNLIIVEWMKFSNTEVSVELTLR